MLQSKTSLCGSCMASGDSAERTIHVVLRALEAAGVPYMITGSFASAVHGAPRSTQDFDLVIAPTRDSLLELLDKFPTTDYYISREMALEAFQAEGLFNVIDLNTGWKIDFILRKSRPFSLEEFARRRPVELLGSTLDIATAEDVVIAKLEWAKMGESERQIEDVAGILRTQGTDLDLEYIESWISRLVLTREWSKAQKRAGLDS